MAQNVEAEVKDDILTIKIDLKQEFGESKSGKTTRIASTLGFMDIEDGIILSLNCNKKKPK
jgi:hypothetical protein